MERETVYVCLACHEKRGIAISILSERSWAICIITEIDPLPAIIIVFYIKKSGSGCILRCEAV